MLLEQVTTLIFCFNNPPFITDITELYRGVLLQTFYPSKAFLFSSWPGRGSAHARACSLSPAQVGWVSAELPSLAISISRVQQYLFVTSVSPTHSSCLVGIKLGTAALQ